MEIIPIVIGLTQLVKQQDVLNKKLLPIVAMIIAIIIGALQTFSPEIFGLSIQWLIWGLTASGLYGAGTDIIKKTGAGNSTPAIKK